jgi:hypothetical protein
MRIKTYQTGMTRVAVAALVLFVAPTTAPAQSAPDKVAAVPADASFVLLWRSRG